LDERIFVEPGHVASQEGNTPMETNRFHADLFWMAREPLKVGAPYSLKLVTQDVKCRVASIEQVMDSSTLESPTEPRDQIERNEAARVTIETRAPLVLIHHVRVPTPGR